MQNPRPRLRLALYAIIISLLPLVLWSQSYDGGWALALLKNHQYWGVTSFHGGLFCSWEYGDSPTPRRWKFAAWQSVRAPDSAGLGEAILTPEDHLHQTNYTLLSIQNWHASFFAPEVFHRWHGIVIAHDHGPPRYVGLGASWTDIRLPYWLLAPLAAVITLLTLFKPSRRRRRARQGLCQKCGYDLRASTERCPECGSPIPRALQSPVAAKPTKPLSARLRIRLRQDAPWIALCAILSLILLAEKQQWAQDRRITATIVTPELPVIRSPQTGIAGMSRLPLPDATKKLEKIAGMQFDIDWIALGDPPRSEGTIFNEEIKYYGDSMPLTRLITLMLKDVVWQNKLDEICFYVTGKPKHLLITTRSDLLARFGTTATFHLPNLVEPKNRLSDAELRQDRSDQLCHIIQLEFQDEPAYAGALETKNRGATLTIRTLPEDQPHMAALLKAIQN